MLCINVCWMGDVKVFLLTFLQICFRSAPVLRSGTAAANATVCCDYQACGSALLLTIIAFCGKCINHVVTIHKAPVGIRPYRRDGGRWGQEAVSNMKPGHVEGGDKDRS